MSKAYSGEGILRALSLTFLFLALALYLPTILPVWALPLVALAAIVSASFFDRLRLRAIPSLVLALCAAGIVFAILYLAAVGSARPAISALFLRIALGYWLFVVTALASIASTLAWLRVPRWRTAEPLAILVAFAIVFWSQGNHAITVFPHPLYLALFTTGMLFVTLLRLVLAAKNAPSRAVPVLTFTVPFIALLFSVMGAFNALSVSNNGGLIQPTLFRFDFSPYLSLQNEIKLNDKLVLIVRTAEENSTTLLRRIYLSGWNPDRGFFEENPPGERRQITTVPGKPTDIPHDEFSLRSKADQEYFIVNFDPSSLIAMDFPVHITPYRIWDSSSFNGAYAVTSEITGFIPFELFDCPPPTGNSREGLSAKALAYYTTIDPKTAGLVGPIARKQTDNVVGYYDKIQALTSFLRDGDFRYSLKPGVAPDGNQLRYFLEDTHKGYCTYFAFSLCLMLRSIGIPSRISAGFFLQPDSGALGYYPVRANMAHAWVEVFFPRYGWIAFDPTSNQLAEGENLQISSNPGGDEFLDLLTEIIDKRSLLVPENRGSEKVGIGTAIFRAISFFFSSHVREYFLALALFLASVPAFITTRRWLVIHRSKNARKAILFIAGDLYRALKRAGLRRTKQESRHAFIQRVNDPEATAFFALEQQARYAPLVTDAMRRSAYELSAILKKRYRRHIFRKPHALFALMFLALSFRGLSAQERDANAELLLARAKTAIEAENWESAITVLTGAIRAYPANPSFHYVLGNLYSDQKLYASARKELLMALSLNYPDIELYSRLSEVSSLLNLDEEALAYIRHYLDVKPEDLFGWSNYGWLCYKTNRLDEGISKLHAVLEKYGPDSNLFVGLGNLYTAAFNYPEAKKYYTLAIQNAERLNQPYHASIDYYNRSILEEVFYHFDDAYRDTELSLEATPRSSGYLMQGELELRRHAFKAAFAQYLKAFNLDSTPLASMGLADTLIKAGYPDEAAQYMDAIERKTDLSWISNYGTTTDQYRADMHKTWTDIYQFAMNREKRTVVHSLSTLFLKYWSMGRYSLLHWYHDAMNRVMTARVARYYETSERQYNKLTGEGLRVNSFYFMAFNTWHALSAPYLARARAIETARIPEAEPSYLYESAHLEGDMARMESAISALDPEWERQYLSKALSERIQGSPHLEKAVKLQYIEKLYAIHPAAFVIHDIRLPVSFEYQGDDIKGAKRRFLKIAQLLCKSSFSQEPDAPFVIQATGPMTTLTVSLVEKNNNRTLYTQVINFSTSNSRDIYRFVNEFSTKVFRTDIGLP
jgi:predicted Zn-dependent protease